MNNKYKTVNLATNLAILLMVTPSAFARYGNSHIQLLNPRVKL